MTSLPTFSPAMLNDIALALKDRKRLQTAIVVLRRAASMDPNNHAAMNNLGNLLSQNMEYELAERVLLRAIALDPSVFDPHGNLGLVYMAQGQYEKALETMNRSLALCGAQHPDLAYDRALAHLTFGHWEEGWGDYDARFLMPKTPLVKTDVPRWTGQSLEGKKLWVIAEQGAGDTFLMSRYLPLAAERGARVTLDVPAPLVELFRGYPGVAEVCQGEVRHPEADFHCYLMSLPGLLGATVDNVVPDPGYLRKRAAGRHIDVPSPPGGALRVGLVWAGNPLQQDDHRRSTPLATLLPLAADPDIALYSFQVGPRAEEIKLNMAGSLIHDMGSSLKNWHDTASALSQMDLVVSVCTGAAHLSGALGIPTFVLLSHSAYWAWLHGRSDSPWYPSVRLFRQKVPGDWPHVVAEVQQAIFEFTEKRKAAA